MNDNKRASEMKWIVFYLKEGEIIIRNLILIVVWPLAEYKNYCY